MKSITTPWILAFFLYTSSVGDTNAQLFSIGDFRISKKGEFHENVSMTLPADANVEYGQHVLITSDNEGENDEDEKRLSARKDFENQLAFDLPSPRALIAKNDGDENISANKRTAEIGLVYVNFDGSGDDSNRKDFVDDNDVFVEEADGKEEPRPNGSSIAVVRELSNESKNDNQILERGEPILEKSEDDGMTLGDDGSVIVNGSYEDEDNANGSYQPVMNDTVMANELVETNFVSNHPSMYINRSASGEEVSQTVESVSLDSTSDVPVALSFSPLIEDGEEATEEEERISRSFIKGVNVRYSPATYNSHNRPPWATNSGMSVTQQPSSDNNQHLQHYLRQRGSILPIVRPVKDATTATQLQSVRRPTSPNAELVEKVVLTLPQSHRPQNKQRGEGVFNTLATPKLTTIGQPLPLSTILAHSHPHPYDDVTHTPITEIGEKVSSSNNMSVVHSGRITEASTRLTQRFLLLPIFDGSKQLKIDQSMLVKMMNMDNIVDTSAPNAKGDSAKANAAVERFLQQIIKNSNGPQIRNRNDLVRSSENTSGGRVTAGGAPTHLTRSISSNNNERVRVPAFCRRCYGFWRNVAAQHVPDELMLEYCCTAGTNKGRLFLKRKPV